MPKRKASFASKVNSKKSTVITPESPDTLEDEDDMIEMSKITNKKLAPNNKNEVGISDSPEYINTESNDPYINDGIGNELMGMMQMFEKDLNKTMSAKKMRIEKITRDAVDAKIGKILDLWSNENVSRNNIIDDYCNNIDNILAEWDNDFANQKSQEEKVLRILQQQIKMIESFRSVQLDRVSTIKKMQKCLCKALKKQGEKQKAEMEEAKDELKKDMQLVQRRILMENQQQDVQNVRKSLQALFMI